MDSKPAELILRNGAVHTVNPKKPKAEAVAIVDGLIAAVGTDDEMRELAGPRTEVVDLKGRSLLPGFQDSHVHVSGGGLERTQCDLSEVHGLVSYQEIISTYSAAHSEAEWLTGGGWAMDVFPGGAPLRDDLDQVVPDRPVFLANRDHHSAWANSVAFLRAGIDSATPDPPDGRLERDGRGRPTGTLHEGAMNLVERVLPRVSDEQIAAGILEGQRYLHSLGITAWQEAIVGSYAVVPDCFEAYLALDSAGKLTGRVRGALWWERGKGAGQIDTLAARRGRSLRCSHFSATSVKFMQDGVCENFSAAMLAPYLDGRGHETHNSGTSFFDPEELKSFVTLVDKEGFQAHFHAIGDRAVREVLDAVEAARETNGPSDNRHCAAHIQVVHPDDVARFALLGMLANAQPLWACVEPQMTELTMPFIGPERTAHQYPFASLLASGARLCFGSDWPVSTPDPLAEIHVAVNRTEPPGYAYGSGEAAEALIPDERLSLEQAVAAFTAGSAHFNHFETDSGTIEKGKRADLVVLDQDLFSVTPEEIALVRAAATVVDGEIVYGSF